MAMNERIYHSLVFRIHADYVGWISDSYLVADILHKPDYNKHFVFHLASIFNLNWSNNYPSGISRNYVTEYIVQQCDPMIPFGVPNPSPNLQINMIS